MQPRYEYMFCEDISRVTPNTDYSELSYYNTEIETHYRALYLIIAQFSRVKSVNIPRGNIYKYI